MMLINQSAASAAVEKKNPLVPKTVQDVGADIIRMEACMAAWNERIVNMENPNFDVSNAMMLEAVWNGQPYTLDNIQGTKYAYISSLLAGVDICGWYFIPGTSSASDVASVQSGRQAAAAQRSAIEKSLSEFQRAAGRIIEQIPKDVISDNIGLRSSAPRSQFDPDFKEALAAYQKNVQMAFASVPSSAVDSMPITHPPDQNVGDDRRPHGFLSWLVGTNSSEAWELRKQVSHDISLFDLYPAPE